MRQSWETMTSVSAGHIILTPTQPVGSGRPQRESNPGPHHQESRALPQSYRGNSNNLVITMIQIYKIIFKNDNRTLVAITTTAMKITTIKINNDICKRSVNYDNKNSNI